jgi:hypothetical protein
MKLGASIGLFFGLSVVLIGLYVLVIVIRNYCFRRENLDEIYEERMQSESNLVELDITSLPMKSNTARSKATFREESERGMPKNIIYGVFKDELEKAAALTSIEIPTFLAYRHG